MANGQQSTLVREPSIQGKAFHGFQPSGVHPFVRDINIESMTVGKLTAGTMTADVTIANTFKTSDTGQRVEIDADGIRGIDSSGDTLFNVRTDTDPLFEFKSSGDNFLQLNETAGLDFFIDRTGTVGESTTRLNWSGIGDGSETAQIETILGSVSIFALTVVDHSGNDDPRLRLRAESPASAFYSEIKVEKDRVRILGDSDNEPSSALIDVLRTSQRVDVVADEMRVDDTGGQRLLDAQTSPGGSQTALRVLVNYGTGGTSTGLQMERVAIGAEDSAGTGWRLLRIPN